MSDNPFVLDSEDNKYVKHNYQTGKWCIGDLDIDVTHMMVDLDSMKLGWSSYDNSTKSYDTIWQPDLYTKIDRPSENHKRSFSVWVFPKFVEGKQNFDHGALLWQRNSNSEFQGFMELGRVCWEEQANNEGLLPVVKVLESTEIVYKSGFKAYTPHFELLKFQERPEKFVIPTALAESEESGGDSPPVNEKALPDSPLNTIDDEDIPF